MKIKRDTQAAETAIRMKVACVRISQAATMLDALAPRLTADAEALSDAQASLQIALIACERLSAGVAFVTPRPRRARG